MFGCANLETDKQLSVVEGTQGYFFRIIADLRMDQQLSEHTADEMAALSDALEAGGTTLVYVPIPTKSLVMPEYLPRQARDYGFDYGVAKRVYDDVITRLRNHGVVTVDVLGAMQRGGEQEPAFFQADFHWTSSGARAAADEIASVIQQLPGIDDLAKASFETKPVGRQPIISTMRRLLQASCKQALPLPETNAFTTTEMAAGDSGLDIFGDGPSKRAVALVGTSYSDLAASNFAGFLSQALSSPVTNYSISGGNQFGSITSYLTSKVFAEARPRFLIWENPIYNSLGKFGDAPLLELRTAADQSCHEIEPDDISTVGNSTLEIALQDGEIPNSAVIYAYSGDDRSRQATLRFRLNDGHMFESSIRRADRMISTGRYYFPVRYFGMQATQKINLEFDRMSANEVSVGICNTSGG
ncbi:hypothetical protein [Rhizobium sp. Root1220]|uniref:alginate O-acetyltransferase AlgX-related protein n=1 Tax=Rhizobium sp. Root1220 TaxID=1736432 RepID=UPI0006F5DD10|nr:hypothetical protein [Rhizobium sp. Root1220]KQV70463.1 hypothetical protein ASC90_10220 [Rhizobium sp. Root1220]